MTGKRVVWAAYDDSVVYPREQKDAAGMTEAEVRQCINNAVSNVEYNIWNPENLPVSVAS